MEKKFNNDNYFSNGWKSDEWSSDGWSSDGWFSDEKSELSFNDLEGIAGGFAPPTVMPAGIIPQEFKDSIIPGAPACQDSNKGEQENSDMTSPFFNDNSKNRIR